MTLAELLADDLGSPDGTLPNGTTAEHVEDWLRKHCPPEVIAEAMGGRCAVIPSSGVVVLTLPPRKVESDDES